MALYDVDMVSRVFEAGAGAFRTRNRGHHSLPLALAGQDLTQPERDYTHIIHVMDNMVIAGVSWNKHFGLTYLDLSAGGIFLNSMLQSDIVIIYNETESTVLFVYYQLLIS